MPPQAMKMLSRPILRNVLLRPSGLMTRKNTPVIDRGPRHDSAEGPSNLRRLRPSRHSDRQGRRGPTLSPGAQPFLQSRRRRRGRPYHVVERPNHELRTGGAGWGVGRLRLQSRTQEHRRIHLRTADSRRKGCRRKGDHPRSPQRGRCRRVDLLMCALKSLLDFRYDGVRFVSQADYRATGCMVWHAAGRSATSLRPYNLAKSAPPSATFSNCGRGSIVFFVLQTRSVILLRGSRFPPRSQLCCAPTPAAFWNHSEQESRCLDRRRQGAKAKGVAGEGARSAGGGRASIVREESRPASRRLRRRSSVTDMRRCSPAGFGSSRASRSIQAKASRNKNWAPSKIIAYSHLQKYRFKKY